METCVFYRNKKIESAGHILAKVQHLRSVKERAEQRKSSPPTTVPNKRPKEKKRCLGSQQSLFKIGTGSLHHRVQSPSKRPSMLVNRQSTQSRNKLAREAQHKERSSMLVSRPPTRRCSKLAGQAIKEESESSESMDSKNDSTSSYSSSEFSPTSPRFSRSPPEAAPIASLSEYEQQRQQKMQERLQFLASLEIGDAKDSLRELLPRPQIQKGIGGIKPASKRKLSPRSPVSVRKSLRLQQRPADAPSPRYDSSFTSISSIYSPAPPSRSRRQPGKSLEEYLPEWQNKESWQESLLRLQELSSASTVSVGYTGSVTSVFDSMRRLRLGEDDVAKVVPERITSMAMHPSNDHDLVLCGDKTGVLGVWMPDPNSDTKGAWPFAVHGRGITRLTVDSSNHNNVFTSSYDGSTRATDLHSNKMTEVFSVEDDRGHPTWHAQQDNHTLLVSTADGDLAQVDLRRPGSDATVHSLDTRKSIKLITVHPTTTNYFASANTSGTVCLWDCRHLRADKPLCSLTHNRTLTGLNFSPITGSTLLATCYDDTIRLLSMDNFSTITNKDIIKHDNQTGRWLTTLKADFLPGREDLFIVGSMHSERVVEVWSSVGSLCHRFAGDLLTTYSTTVSCHPTRPVVAAGNSSGRCHLFR